MRDVEEHWIVHYNTVLHELAEESRTAKDQSALELRALKTIQEFKQTITASMLSDDPELGTLLLLVKEYRETLRRARELCFPATKRQLVKTLRKLNELHDKIGRIAGWISHKNDQ